MDDIVRQAMAKWPNVPNCFGWLALDRRATLLLASTSVRPIGRKRTVTPSSTATAALAAAPASSRRSAQRLSAVSQSWRWAAIFEVGDDISVWMEAIGLILTCLKAHSIE